MTALIPFMADVVVSSGGLGHALVLLVAGVIVLAFLWWVNKEYVPEPMRRYGVLVIVLICVLLLINFVLSLNGNGFIHW